MLLVKVRQMKFVIVVIAMNQNANGNRKMYWKEVSKVKHGKKTELSDKRWKRVRREKLGNSTLNRNIM